MFDVIDDTIVAVSSPAGTGERGIVRCSGALSLSMACDVFVPVEGMSLDELPGFRRVCGRVRLESDCAVPAEVYWFRAPRSYTRQDCVEFHVPGAPILLTMLVERLIGAGARAAEPGEFTARAFLNGAMDLTRVEAVGSLIRSRSDAQLRVARRMMDGRLARRTDGILEAVAELVALVEADIDFAEEPIVFITPEELLGRLDVIADRLERLQSDTATTERIDVLPRILLVGRSNAGKSTLMNRLSGIDRAICSHERGTTRDILSAPVSVGGGEAVLLDAAGVDRETVGLLRAAASATLSARERVDVLCLVVDLTEPVDASVFAPLDTAVEMRCVIVGNKTDGLDEAAVAARARWLTEANRGAVCVVSARDGTGMETCRALLASVLNDPDTGMGADAVVVTARQREAVGCALAAVQRCRAEADNIGETIDRADILAFELREALEHLGRIAGGVTTDELLGRVFASFCIGK